MALDAQNRVCLLRQYRFIVDQWLWELPAGKLETGETTLETAQRELGEEAGVSARRAHRIGDNLFRDVLLLGLKGSDTAA